jgi:hypothetical protein
MIYPSYFFYNVYTEYKLQMRENKLGRIKKTK